MSRVPWCRGALRPVRGQRPRGGRSPGCGHLRPGLHSGTQLQVWSGEGRKTREKPMGKWWFLDEKLEKPMGRWWFLDENIEKPMGKWCFLDENIEKPMGRWWFLDEHGALTKKTDEKWGFHMGFRADLNEISCAKLMVNIIPITVGYIELVAVGLL